MSTTLLPARQRVAPALTLLVLSPLIVEFLFGSTHISMFYLLLPQIGVYGCGVLLLRAVVRQRHRGWGAILLLGIAFAIVEECLILQTALAPLFIAADPQHIYGRSLGVNWVYLLFQLGYESVWAIILPILLTELIFPDRRMDPWVGRRGLVILPAVYLLASAGTWYLWSQAVRRLVPGPGYEVPPLTFAVALAAIAVLAIVALGSRSASHPMQQSTRRAPRPWLARLVAFLLALLWFVPVILAVGVAPSLPAVAPVIAGLGLAALAIFLVRRWSASSAWRDTHRLALIAGALFASMLLGFLASGKAAPVDVIGKLVLNLAAVLGLLYLGRRMRTRKPAASDA